jgi:hypothetical protein
LEAATAEINENREKIAIDDYPPFSPFEVQGQSDVKSNQTHKVPKASRHRTNTTPGTNSDFSKKELGKLN